MLARHLSSHFVKSRPPMLLFATCSSFRFKSQRIAVAIAWIQWGAGFRMKASEKTIHALAEAHTCSTVLPLADASAVMRCPRGGSLGSKVKRLRNNLESYFQGVTQSTLEGALGKRTINLGPSIQHWRTRSRKMINHAGAVVAACDHLCTVACLRVSSVGK